MAYHHLSAETTSIASIVSTVEFVAARRGGGNIGIGVWPPLVMMASRCQGHPWVVPVVDGGNISCSRSWRQIETELLAAREGEPVDWDLSSAAK